MKNALLLLIISLFSISCVAQKIPNGPPNTIYGMIGTSQGWVTRPTNGINGINGTNGTNGSSFLNGSGVPATTVGNNGDSYLDFTALNIYTKAGGIWTLRNNIKGATGLTGATGATGASGSSTSGLPTTANNYDRLTWFNGAWVALPANHEWEQNWKGQTTGLNLGFLNTDLNWTDYLPGGYLNITNIIGTGSVSIDFAFTDNINPTVTQHYTVTASTIGTTFINLTPPLKILATSFGAIQVTTTVTGSLTYDVYMTVDQAP